MAGLFEHGSNDSSTDAEELACLLRAFYTGVLYLNGLRLKDMATPTIFKSPTEQSGASPNAVSVWQDVLTFISSQDMYF